VVAALALLGTVQPASAAGTVAMSVRLANVTQKCHTVVTSGGAYMRECSVRGKLYVKVGAVQYGCKGTGTFGPGDSVSFGCPNHTRFSRTSIPWKGSYAYHITVALGAHTYEFDGYPKSVPLQPGGYLHWTFRAQRY
jgi:hypothetical protein